MNKPRIWITRKLSDATLERAQKDYDVVVNLEDQPGTKQEIISASYELMLLFLAIRKYFLLTLSPNLGQG